jgi:putative redox protein
VNHPPGASAPATGSRKRIRLPLPEKSVRVRAWTASGPASPCRPRTWPRRRGAGQGRAGANVAGMTTDSAHRGVRLERIENSKYVVTNDRGGQIRIGRGDGTDFTPVDLLLSAIAGCTAVDVDILTSRRAEPEKFEIVVDADKISDKAGNRLTGIVVTFRIRFPEGEGGDKARALLPDAVRKSHDRLCTVSRTVELGTPIANRIE